MMVCVYGFPSKVAALQFEWAWQNPLKSKALQPRRELFQGRIGRSPSLVLGVDEKEKDKNRDF